MMCGNEHRRLKTARFFAGVIVVQTAINVAGGTGTYSDMLSNLPLEHYLEPLI